MSQEKINSTINNLCQKYEITPWKNILPLVFKGNAFNNLLEQLLTDVEQGIKWEPSFKDSFNTFNNTDIKKLEVIVISSNPFKFTSEEMKMQGVIYLSVPMFVVSDNADRYKEHSEKVIIDLVSKLAYQTTGTIYVFVGDDVEHIGDCVDNKHHKKIFIPEFYVDEVDLRSVVNNMLIQPIKWD
jgi:uracil DNA glycosylase